MSVSQETQPDYLQRPPWYEVALTLLRKQPLAAFGGLLVALLVIMALVPSLIAPHDPEVIQFSSMLQPPDSVYWLGTDQFGRDLLSRIIYGARTALFIGFVAAFTGATTGLILGVASAFFGGRIDLFIQRVIDVLIAFPTIIIALDGRGRISARTCRT